MSPNLALEIKLSNLSIIICQAIICNLRSDEIIKNKLWAFVQGPQFHEVFQKAIHFYFLVVFRHETNTYNFEVEVKIKGIWGCQLKKKKNKRKIEIKSRMGLH